MDLKAAPLDLEIELGFELVQGMNADVAKRTNEIAEYRHLG